MSFQHDLDRKMSAMIQEEASGIPSFKCWVSDVNDSDGMIMSWSGWSVSLHQVSKEIDVFKPKVELFDYDEKFDFFQDHLDHAIATEDVEEAVRLMRPLITEWSNVQRERSKRALDIGITRPLNAPSIDTPELTRIDHLTFDEEIVRYLGDSLPLRAAKALSGMTKLATPHNFIVSAWAEETDFEENKIDIHPQAPIALFSPEVLIDEEITWLGHVIRIEKTLLPIAILIASAGRELGQLIATGSALDQRKIKRIVHMGRWTDIELELKPVSISNYQA